MFEKYRGILAIIITVNFAGSLVSGSGANEKMQKQVDSRIQALVEGFNVKTADTSRVDVARCGLLKNIDHKSLGFEKANHEVFELRRSASVLESSI